MAQQQGCFYLTLYFKALTPCHVPLTGKSSEFCTKMSISSLKSSTDVSRTLSRNSEFEICACSRWRSFYAVTFCSVKQIFNLKSSITNQLMEPVQVGMVMHVSLLVGWTFIVDPGSVDGEDKSGEH